MSEERPAVLALDIGGTQIRAASVLSDGECLGRVAAATPVADGAEAIYETASLLLRRVRDGLPSDVRTRLTAIGISSMGPVDPWRGLVVDPPNVPCLRDAPLADEIERRVGLPAYLERDTNVAALAEHWRGAARGCADFLYVTVSTGLGGAIFSDGGLILGPDGTAGELGHVSLIDDGGPRCGCGGIGHLEGIASGSGLAAQATAALAGEAQAAAAQAAAPARAPAAGGATAAVAPAASPFLALRAATRPLTGRDVAEGETAGDELCTQLMGRARRAFAIACVGWVNAFNPERIVVGGTVAERQGDALLAPARDEVSRTALRAPASRVRIVGAELGDDVGLIGAWPLVRERHGDPIWRASRAPGAPSARP